MGPALVYFHPIDHYILLVREMEIGKDRCAIYDGVGDKVKFWLHSLVQLEYEYIGEL